MKFSELMLDYATGDACPQDAYIAEALGQIKVSKAIYEAALDIASMDRDEIQYIQEAAADAGMPTNKKDAIGVAKTAVNRAANGFIGVVSQCNDKLKSSASKSWQAICGAAKMTKVPVQGDIRTFAESFAERIAAKANKDDVDLRKAFRDGNSLRTAASNYMKAISNVLPTSGIRLETSNHVVTEYATLGTTSYSNGDPARIANDLEYATTVLERPIQEAYDLSVSDIADYVEAVYVIKEYASDVEDILTDGVRASGANYASQNAGKRGSTAVMLEYANSAERIIDMTSQLTKAMNDSGYGLGMALNGGVAPLPQAE